MNLNLTFNLLSYFLLINFININKHKSKCILSIETIYVGNKCTIMRDGIDLISNIQEIKLILILIIMMIIYRKWTILKWRLFMVSIQWNTLRIYNLMLQSVRKEFSHNLKTPISEAPVKVGPIKNQHIKEVEANRLKWDPSKWEIDLLTLITMLSYKPKTRIYKINLPVFKTNLKVTMMIEKLTKYSVKLVKEQWREPIK